MIRAELEELAGRQIAPSWQTFIAVYPVRFSRLLYNFYCLKEQRFYVGPLKDHGEYHFVPGEHIWAQANLPVVAPVEYDAKLEKNLIHLEQAVELAKEQANLEQARAVVLAKLTLEERRLLNV